MNRVEMQDGLEDLVISLRLNRGKLVRSTGDAVIVTDAASRITRMNPVAESLTGWSVREALGLPLAEVFRVLSEETGRDVESPAERVRRSGATVGVANDTILVRRDGSGVAIDDSASPVHEDDGRLSRSC
jgi:PAS domain S-box-containing protein